MKRFFKLLLIAVMLTFGLSTAMAEEAVTPPTVAPTVTTTVPNVPIDVKALRNQARDLHKADKPEQALIILGQAIAQFPQDADNYSLRASILNHLKRYEAAIADMRLVTKLEPDSASAWGSLGWYLILQGDFPAAQAASIKAQQLAPDSMAWTINLGHTYLLQGDSKTARVWYQKTIPLIADEDALKSGPLADFDIFIDNGWQIAASREERGWFESTARQSIQVILKKQRTAEQRQLALNLLVTGKEDEAIAILRQLNTQEIAPSDSKITITDEIQKLYPGLILVNIRPTHQKKQYAVAHKYQNMV